MAGISTTPIFPALNTMVTGKEKINHLVEKWAAGRDENDELSDYSAEFIKVLEMMKVQPRLRVESAVESTAPPEDRDSGQTYRILQVSPMVCHSNTPPDWPKNTPRRPQLSICGHSFLGVSVSSVICGYHPDSDSFPGGLGLFCGSARTLSGPITNVKTGTSGSSRSPFPMNSVGLPTRSSWKPCDLPGPSGQHVKITESAVRVVHVPTRIGTIAREERSQFLNRILARARLHKLLDQKASRRGEANKEKWSAHNRLQRGNPVRVFK